MTRVATKTALARLIVGGCLVLATVAACGSRAAAGGSGGPVLTESPRPHPSVLTQPAVPAPDTTVVTVPTGPGSEVPTSKLRAIGPTAPPRGVQVSQDGRSITFGAAQAGCQHVSAALLSQTATAVTIQIRRVTTNSGGQVCPMIVREVPLSVRLSAPLGDRKVVFEGAQPITSNH